MSLPAVYIQKRKFYLILLILSGLLQVIALVCTALLVRSVIDIARAPSAGNQLPLMFAGLLASSLALVGLRFAGRLLAENIGQSYVHDVRVELFESLLKSKNRISKQASTGRMLLPFTGDLSALRRWVSLGLSGAIVSSVVLTFSLIALSIYSVEAALAALLVMVCGILFNILLSKPTLKAVKYARQRRSKMISNLTEKITHPVVVAFFGRARRETDRHSKLSFDLKNALFQKSVLARGMRAGTELTAMWAGTAVLAVVIYTSGTTVSAGTIVALMTLIGLLATPLRDLGRVYEYWLNMLVSRNNLMRFNQGAGKEKHSRNRKIESVKGNVSFKNLSLFRETVPVNAEIEPGKRIALIGLNGAGKSTLLMTIAGLRQSPGGVISLDGTNVQRLKASTARQSIGIVSDLLPLMQGSLDKNLRYRHPGASSEEVDAILSQCGLDSLVESLPDGKKTRLTREGLNLSLGERRRVALARALLGSPVLLLLDEIESNLDPVFTRDLEALLASYKGTIIQATHNEAMACNSDEIWLIADGEIIISENPETFMKEFDDMHQFFKQENAVGQE